MLLYFTQLIYLREGGEEAFHQFEDVVLPLLPKYNGQLLLRLRPTEDSFVAHTIEKPYEMHLLTFESEEDFARFVQDKTRKQFLHLKEQSVASVLLLKGTQP